jgi:polysaccharide export outer membrane protein
MRSSALLLGRAAVLLLGVATACLTACATRGLEIKDLPELSGPSLPPVEVREVTLGPGDEIEVFVWKEPDLSRRAKVTSSGYLPFPLIGDFRITGMNIHQVRDHIAEALNTYLVSPKVSVSILAVKSKKVYVFGEVRNPGVYALDSDKLTTLAEAIGQAGGWTDDAKRSEVLLIRGNPQKVYIRPVDLDALVKKGDLRENPPLTQGDIVYVPVRTMATVQREARRIVDILGPVLALEDMFLRFETATILWSQFTDILIQGQTGARAPGAAPRGQSQIIIVSPPTR